MIRFPCIIGRAAITANTGNTFLALFLSSHYSVDISSGEIKDKNNLVFKYVITSWENSLTDEYLNQTFGLSNGDYYSWYKKY